MDSTESRESSPASAAMSRGGIPAATAPSSSTRGASMGSSSCAPFFLVTGARFPDSS